MNKPRVPNELARLISKVKAEMVELEQSFKDAYAEDRRKDCLEIDMAICECEDQLDALHAELEASLGQSVPRE